MDAANPYPYPLPLSLQKFASALLTACLLVVCLFAVVLIVCLQVNLEAGSASQASAWLYAIDAALRGYSQRRFHHTEADPKAARYYVDGINAPNKYLTLGAVAIESAADSKAADGKNEAAPAPASAGAGSAPASEPSSLTSLQLFSSLPPSDEAYPVVTALKGMIEFTHLSHTALLWLQIVFGCLFGCELWNTHSCAVMCCVVWFVFVLCCDVLM
jgi:hypothetical protein